MRTGAAVAAVREMSDGRGTLFFQRVTLTAKNDPASSGLSESRPAELTAICWMPHVIDAAMDAAVRSMPADIYCIGGGDLDVVYRVRLAES